MKFQCPCVHLNGTAKADLLSALYTSAAAVSAARKTLSDAWPHARDYYVLPNGTAAYQRARSEHASRVERLENIYSELLAIHEAIHDGKTETEDLDFEIPF